MELSNLEPSFSAPISGMSMTHEVGARPWQQPPQYVKMEDIVDYYVTRMGDDSFQTQLVNIIDSGIPITSLANSIQLSSVMQGVHSIDSGLLVMPVLMELMMFVAEQNDVKYTTGMERNKKEEIEDSIMQNALSKFEKDESLKTEESEGFVEEEQEDIEDAPLDNVDVPDGLMSRRVV
tara:strand:+ start:1344 stop:1877 length:534 start_codon:yes stop_codon:yes gene_type:complete